MEVTRSEDRFSFCDSDVDSDVEVLSELDNASDAEVRSLLEFSGKISNQIVSYFQSNSRKEDTCDVYEDKFSSPPSGSHSYYRDILAMAQINDHSITVEAVKSHSPSDSNCAWLCTGYRNPDLGVGPLEELFRVLRPASKDVSETVPFKNDNLEPQDGISRSRENDNPANMNADVCSTIMDAFNRWNNDSFSQHLSDAVEDLHTFGDDLYINP